jgi:hypothetical protein
MSKTDMLRAAEDLVKSILEKNFNQRVNQESARSAAEKIVRTLPVAPESKRAA